MKLAYLAFSGLSLFSHSSFSAHAIDTTAIAVRNSLPIMAGAGLDTPKSATLEASGTFGINLNGNIESHAGDSGSNVESLILDGEVHSLALSLNWGVAPLWQLSLGVRGMRNTSGQFDSAIDSWHDVFGLDDGDRAQQTEDQLLFSYSGPDDSAQIDQANKGLGDLRFGASRQLVSAPNFKLAVHGELNLPNGKGNDALGSAKTDTALSLAAAGFADTLGWHSNLGVLAIGDDSLFAVPTKSSTWFTSLGAHWQPNEHWRWSAQLDGHGAVFDSAIEELNQNAWQIALAGEWRTQAASFQLYFTEDLSVNSAADFAFGVNLRFQRR